MVVYATLLPPHIPGYVHPLLIKTKHFLQKSFIFLTARLAAPDVADRDCLRSSEPCVGRWYFTALYTFINVLLNLHTAIYLEGNPELLNVCGIFLLYWHTRWYVFSRWLGLFIIYTGAHFWDGLQAVCYYRVYEANNILYRLSCVPYVINPLTAKLFNLNFHSLEVVSRWRDPQLQVSENYSYLTKWRSTVFKSCWLMSHFIFNIFKM